ncbi:uncharacterized protein [Porites lutea]
MEEDYREWSVERVGQFLEEKGFEKEVIEKFAEQKVKGRHLSIMKKSQDKNVFQACGLTTVGEQMEFISHIESLENIQGEVHAVPQLSAKTSSVVLPKNIKYSPPTRKEKLTAAEIKKLDPSTKLVYMSVLTRIRKATSEKFPGNEIPLIRSNPEVAAKVNALVDELADDCCIKSIEFGKDGIRQHIKAVLYERKRMINLGHSYERKSKKIRESGSESSESASTSAGNDTDILSDDDSSSDTSNAVSPCMHLQSAEQIVCKVFGKTTSSHVQLHRHIIPA